MTVLINRTMSVCMSTWLEMCVSLCARRPRGPAYVCAVPRCRPGRVEYGVRVLAVSCEPTPVDDRALA